MVATIDVFEGQPDAWPTVIGLADDFDRSATWQRIEGWIAWRWGERDVVFIAEGPGDWRPPLRPATVETVEVWAADAWTNAVLRPSPRGGYMLEGEGPYRFTATVGGAETPPASVIEAVRRLHGYLATTATDDLPAVASASDGDFSFTRAASWSARAIHASGAGDLLRPWRNLGAD